MNPETFQSERVANKEVLKDKFEVDQDVSIVLSDKGALIV